MLQKLFSNIFSSLRESNIEDTKNSVAEQKLTAFSMNNKKFEASDSWKILGDMVEVKIDLNSQHGGVFYAGEVISGERT